MNQTTNPDSGFAYHEMEGWPATPGTHRMTEASRTLTSGDADHSGTDQPGPDPGMMYLVTAAHHFTIDDHLLDQANQQSPGEGLTTLLDHAGEADTEHTFGCLAFASHQSTLGIPECQHIFALVRDQE